MNMIPFRILLLLCIAVPLNVDAEQRFALRAGLNYSDTDTVQLGNEIDSTFGRTFSGTGLRIEISYAVGDTVNLEGGWARLGSDTGIVSTQLLCLHLAPCPPRVDFHLEQRGYAGWLVVTPTMRRGDFALFCKLGAAYTSIEMKEISPRVVDDVVSDIPLRSLDSATSTKLLLGAGIGFDLTDTIGLRLDFERLGSSARAAGVSVEYRF